MKVIEIFKSIEGEGVRAGYPCTFIRLAGCNLRCSYCDTKYSYDLADGTEMSAAEIVRQVYLLGCKRVTITGGEPLLHDHIDELLVRLVRDKFDINIETNGSIDVSAWAAYANIIVTMDYKCPSSGMEDHMKLSNLSVLSAKDVIKFVVGTEEDLDCMRKMIKFTNAQVFVSPVFGKIDPKQIVRYLQDNHLDNCRIQLQLHKIIWDPDMRGV